MAERVAGEMETPPKSWWQWVLLYPTLAISIVGAIPTVFEVAKSYSIGVDFGFSREAIDQAKLWETNFQCSQQAVFYNKTTASGVEIGSFVCDSGDVLLRGKRPGAREQFRWLSWNQVASEKRSALISNMVLQTALAEEHWSELAQARPTTVICQKRLPAGRVLQRIENGPRVCFDQIINTFNGQVVDRRPAPCNPSC